MSFCCRQTQRILFLFMYFVVYTDMNENCDLISVKSVQNIHLFSEHQKRFMIIFFEIKNLKNLKTGIKTCFNFICGIFKKFV